MRLHSLEIPVQDMARAFRFYAEVLGFPIIGRRGDDTASFFLGDVHGQMISLVRASPPPDGRGPTIVLFAQEGVAAMRARLEARGVRFLGPTEERPLGPFAYFLDSEGNRLALCQPSRTLLLHQQAEQPLTELRRALEALEQRTWEILAGVREEQARYRPAPGEWTIIDQMGHIIDSLDSCGVLATDLAHGRQPVLSALWREIYPSASLAAVLAEARRAYQGAYGWLEALPPSPNLEATLPHGVFGPLNCKEWIAFMLFHIGIHLNQIEAVKASPGYPAS